MAHSTPDDRDEFARVVPFGKYEIPVDPATGERQLLGEGGMGQTYKARDARLGRPVVLKVISSAFHNNPDARKRFLREAKALGLLQHPAVPVLYEYGEEKGDDFYAMEFIAGEDLQKRVTRVDALSIADTLNIIEQAARALGAAHRAGIIHRDVKPSNLMLSRPAHGGPESVKLIDFGLAKGVGAAADLGASSTGSPGGYTPLYASPEQCKGEPVVPQSDLYSLGATMWFLLTGRPPFSGTSIFDLQKKHVEAPLSLDRLPLNLPEPVRDLLERLLAKRPEDRPETADEVAGQIAMMRKLLGTQPVSPAAYDADLAEAQTLHRPPTVGRQPTVPVAPAPPPASVQPLPPPPASNRGWLLLGIGAAVAATGLLGWFGAKSPLVRSWLGPAPTPTPTAAPQPTRIPTAVPRPTVLPTATPRPQPTRAPVPTPTPLPVPTATPRPTPTATPIPTATATPRPTAVVLSAVSKSRPYENRLGMKFVPVPRANVLFSVWETRRRDFEVFAREQRFTQPGGVHVLRFNRAGAGSVTAWEPDATASWERPGFEQTGFHPVVGVSADDAMRFCAWLTEIERAEGRIGPTQVYRLPTDAEWSLAVGPGRFPWGGDNWPPPAGSGNYFDSAGIRSFPPGKWLQVQGDDGYARTSPAGAYKENVHGLYDLGGNVSEWTLTDYRTTLNEAEVLRVIPALRNDRGPAGKPYRVLRGGSWSNVERERCLSSCRSSAMPDYRGVNVGFRVVLAER